MSPVEGVQLASAGQCRALLFLLLEGWQVKACSEYQVDHVRFPVFEVGGPGAASGFVCFDGAVKPREGVR